MNILVLAPFSDAGLAGLRAIGRVGYEPWTQTQMLHDPEELGQRLDAEGYEAVVVEADFLFDDLFTAAPLLRFAAICRAALNQVDLDAATAAGVVVVHTPGRNAQAVAELVLGHLLGLARHIPQASRFVSERAWTEPAEAYVRFRGRELAGATLGLVGLGEIGRRVAALARGVGMRVIAHDPYVEPSLRGGKSVELVGLDALLEQSDFVSLHLPGTPETAGMLSAERIARMRPGAYLVNVSAPSVVDLPALASALRQGRLGGVALDVHESHPLAADSPFLDLPNAILTPHIGGATAETIERHSAMVLTDLSRFLAGLRPRHLANPSAWRRRRQPRSR